MKVYELVDPTVLKKTGCLYVVAASQPLAPSADTESALAADANATA